MAINRRNFLKASGALAALSIVPRHVLGGNGNIAPSDQLTKGIIGVGGMGRGHYGYANTRLVAICDCDKKHLQQGLDLAKQKAAAGDKKVDANPKAYEDWRELVYDPNVDIVHIATPPHWHALQAIEAAKAGKLLHLPERADIPENIKEQLIVELYSK